MPTLSFQQVEQIRARLRQARELAASRFRDAFAAAPADLPPNERWRAHLEIQANTLVSCAQGLRLAAGERIAVFIDESRGRTVTPVVVSDQAPALTGAPVAGHRFFSAFTIDQTPEALFEYFLVISEIQASPGWSVTTVIASLEEYNTALARMRSPQLVRPLELEFLPSAEWRADDSAMVEVTVYSRDTEERIERRRLTLDSSREFHFHDRELIAEGTGGVRL